MDNECMIAELPESRQVATSISVIMPLYNKADTVARAIKSVLRQGVDLEVIVVDDGSTDGSGLVAKSFGDQIRYIWQENAGPSAARNRGVQASRSPILAFLDADDEFLPGCLAAHLACRNTRPDVKITISPHRAMREIITRRIEDFISCGSFYYSNRFLDEIVHGIHIDAVCINRELFNTIDRFDIELRCWEITDFVYRLLIKSPLVGFLDKNYIVVHKNSANSQFSRTRTDVRFMKRYIYKRLHLLNEVTEDQKKLVSHDIIGFLKTLLVMGAQKDVKEILQQMRESGYNDWGESIELRALYLLSCLPYCITQRVISLGRMSLRFTKK
jgi:glycosyltransferase involved in cell wall biosynthesis